MVEIEPALTTLRASVAHNGSPARVRVAELSWGAPLADNPEVFGKVKFKGLTQNSQVDPAV
jgi:hypothetical protein